MFKQADIVVVKFPFTDGSDFKKRPALVISNELVNKTSDCLIVQITSKINNDGLSIAIEDIDCLRPLPLKSYVRPHRIFTIPKALLLSKVTSVSPKFLKTVVERIYNLIES